MAKKKPKQVVLVNSRVMKIIEKNPTFLKDRMRDGAIIRFESPSIERRIKESQPFLKLLETSGARTWKKPEKAGITGMEKHKKRRKGRRN